MRKLAFLIALLLCVEVASAISFSSPYGVINRCKDYEVCVPYHREFRIETGSGTTVKVRDLAESYTPRSAVPISSTSPRVIRGSFSARFPSRRN